MEAHMKNVLKRIGFAGSVLFIVALLLAPGSSAQNGRHFQRGGTQEADDVADAASQFAEARTAAGIVLPGAYSAAFASLAAIPVVGGTWTEETVRPYNSDDPRYRDPNFSNSSAGWGLVAGRITGLTVGGGFIYAGGANGGVFRSQDSGHTWT